MWFHFLRLTVPALGVVAIFVGSDASAAEQRCGELGSACTCSEPLNSDQFALSGQLADPADSTTKECRGIGDAPEHNYPVDASQTDGLPSSVDYVWRSQVNSTGGGRLNGVEQRSSDARRLCIRYYVRYSSDYQPKDKNVGGTCEANKATQLDIGGGGGRCTMHNRGATTADPNDTFRIATKNDWTTGNNNLNSQGNLIFSDCKKEWCRYEVCMSGDLAAGRNISIDGYVVGLSSGKKLTWPRTQVGDCRAGGHVRTTWIMNLYRQGTCAGHKWFSHAMQAEWDVDKGQYIGPAVEIEGDGAVPSPSGGSGSGSDPDSGEPDLGAPGKPVVIDP